MAGEAEAFAERVDGLHDGCMLRWVADHPSLADLAFADLELRFDQGQDAAVWAEQADCSWQDEPQGDERRIDHYEVDRLR